ncbi:hypothetical protein AX17_006794 [Amanita inopinata Kibby_2008]|nr:hypothetical protein AX17_006794 [Amanita inopinata Kibby_2008]
MTAAIIFYDIASKLTDTALSPNTWKTRLVLNYKGLPYKTEWVELPDIEAKCKELGVGPTDIMSDKPLYTLPAIYDPNTQTAIADSYHIARYLDKTYPNTPRVIPEGTEVFQIFPLFPHVMGSNLAFWSFTVPATYAVLNPQSLEYFRRTREAMFGKEIEDMELKGAEAEAAWKQLKDGYDAMDKMWQLSKGPHMMGETLSYMDLVIASWSFWLRAIFGKDSEKWKDITSWNGGRWGMLFESLTQYESLN